MTNLFTRDEFATWCQTTIAPDDAFATMVMDQATVLVVDAANAPGWELDPSTAPRLAKLIALRVARRTYLNPDQELSSTVGPISASILKDAAAGMTLTETELAQLLDLAPDGDPNDGVLWVQKVTRGTADTLPIIELPSEYGPIPYAYEGETSAFDPLVDDGGSGSYDGPTMAAFSALAAQVAGLTTTKADVTAVTPKADKTYVDAQDATKADAAATTAALAGKADAAATTAALATKADQAAIDDLFDDVNAELATKANTADLGVQIRTTQPESGSGELWADTTGA
jgi:hypothetical protein